MLSPHHVPASEGTISPSTTLAPCQAPTMDTHTSLQQHQHANMEPFRLLSLPAELRNMVYTFSLTIPQPLSLIIHYPDIVALAPGQATSLSPTILATCRQIGREATPILYSGNTFSFCHAPFVPTALEALRCGAQHIHAIEISHMTCDEVAELVEFLPQLSGLVKVVVHAECRRHTEDPLRVVARLGPLVKALHGRWFERGGQTAMEIMELPISGEDGKWWVEVEEAFREIVEFVDAEMRRGSRMSNF